MCDKKDLFFDFDGNFRELVKLGDNLSMVVLWKGNIRMQVNEIIQIITGVFYVLSSKEQFVNHSSTR